MTKRIHHRGHREDNKRIKADESNERVGDVQRPVAVALPFPVFSVVFFSVPSVPLWFVILPITPAAA
jgi:hypothetical protein